MTTDNIKISYNFEQIGCTRSHPHENMDRYCKLITIIAKKDNESVHLKATIAKLEQELCDMTFAYNACSYLLDKINK
jgi:hypothetical protein